MHSGPRIAIGATRTQHTFQGNLTETDSVLPLRWVYQPPKTNKQTNKQTPQQTKPNKTNQNKNKTKPKQNITLLLSIWIKADKIML